MKVSDQSQQQPLTFLPKQKPPTNITCTSGHTAPYIYINRNCSQSPFACEDKSCKCHSHHKKCIKAQTATILQNLLQGDFSSQHISNTISSYFDSAIDQLSHINDRLLTQIKNHQKSYEFIGLSPSQITFVNNMRQANVQEIKCGDIWQVLMGVRHQVSAKEVLKVFESKIQKIRQKMQVQIVEFGQKLMRELQLINRYKIQHFTTSHLIKSPQDQVKLINFFCPRPLLSTTLLYRASQHSFQIQQFHKLCDHIPHTLTICLTQYNKTIGAYTPHQWYKNSQWQFYKDTTGESFVFSLTHGDKFVNDNSEAGIVRRNDNTFGLQFGKNLEWDFLLANKANQNDRSLANINTGFKNKKYTKGDKTSFERFIGNPDGYTFRVKQWEVWRVEVGEPSKDKRKKEMEMKMEKGGKQYVGMRSAQKEVKSSFSANLGNYVEVLSHGSQEEF